MPVMRRKIVRRRGPKGAGDAEEDGPEEEIINEENTNEEQEVEEEESAPSDGNVELLIAVYVVAGIVLLLCLVGVFPIVPVVSIFLACGGLASFLQFTSRREQAANFRDSPRLEELVENFYLANCTMGRMGYQGGELSEERKVELRAEFIRQLTEENDNCPLYWEGWDKTFLPSFFLLWPSSIPKKLKDRQERKEREERERLEREAEEERLRLEEEERERIAAEKAAKKEANAAIQAEKAKERAQQKQKWLEEAEREAEEAKAQEAEDLIVTGKVVSCEELRKKGNYLIEVEYGDDGKRVQVVANKSLDVGQAATVAREGAKLPDGKTAKASKIGGEWSEGVLLG